MLNGVPTCEKACKLLNSHVPTTSCLVGCAYAENLLNKYAAPNNQDTPRTPPAPKGINIQVPADQCFDNDDVAAVWFEKNKGSPLSCKTAAGLGACQGSVLSNVMATLCPKTCGFCAPTPDDSNDDRAQANTPAPTEDPNEDRHIDIDPVNHNLNNKPPASNPPEQTVSGHSHHHGALHPTWLFVGLVGVSVLFLLLVLAVVLRMRRQQRVDSFVVVDPYTNDSSKPTPPHKKAWELNNL